ncbi:MAG: hypothetical protein ACAI38_23425 [Myxococcota bacterium]
MAGRSPAERIAERIQDRFAECYAGDRRVDDTELQGIIDMLANDGDGVTPEELGVAEELLSASRELMLEGFADYRVARDARNALRTRAAGAEPNEELVKAERAVSEAIGEIDAIGELQRVMSRLVLGLAEHGGRDNRVPKVGG